MIDQPLVRSSCRYQPRERHTPHPRSGQAQPNYTKECAGAYAITLGDRQQRRRVVGDVIYDALRPGDLALNVVPLAEHRQVELQASIERPTGRTARSSAGNAVDIARPHLVYVTANHGGAPGLVNAQVADNVRPRLVAVGDAVAPGASGANGGVVAESEPREAADTIRDAATMASAFSSERLADKPLPN